MTDMSAEMAFLQSMQSNPDNYAPDTAAPTVEADGEDEVRIKMEEEGEEEEGEEEEEEEEEEEDDYDPSDLSYEPSAQHPPAPDIQPSGTPVDLANAKSNLPPVSNTASNLATESKPVPAKQPRTLGGFIVDDDDDEEDEEDGGATGGTGNGNELISPTEGAGATDGQQRVASASGSLPRRSLTRTPQVAVQERAASADLSNSNAIKNENESYTAAVAAVPDSTVSSDAKLITDKESSALSQMRKSSAQGSAGLSAPKARLPHDRVGILEDRIAEDSKGDVDAWLALIGEHRKRNKLDDARTVYERFFKIFPSAVRAFTISVKLVPFLTNVNFTGRAMGLVCKNGAAK